MNQDHKNYIKSMSDKIYLFDTLSQRESTSDLGGGVSVESTGS